MTISSTTRIAGPFVGNGTASVFPFTFKVFAAADLDVIRLATSTGVETTLVLNSDYTVSLNGNQNTNPGGSVTLSAGALASGFTLTITSDIANLQPTDLTNQGGFYPEVITDSLDRATIQIQQMADDLTRSIKTPISDGLSLNMELPTAAVRANSFLAFDASGEPTVVTAGSSGAPATITRQVFSGTGSQTVFTLASDPGALGNSAQVYIGGVYQQRSTYTIAGTTLTFSAAPVAGTDNIEFVNFLTSNIGATSADLVTYTPAGSGAVARSAASKFGDVVSVKDFGAVGDGVADDTAAIHAAIDASKAVHGAVYFPAGRYRVTSGYTNSTNNSLVMFGEGLDYYATSAANADGSCVILDSTDPNSFFYRQSAGSNLEVRDMQFACAQYVLDRKFFVQSASSTRHIFENVHFSAVERPFVYLTGTYFQLNSYTNVRFTNSGTFHSTTGTLIGTFMLIENCDVEGIIPANSEKIICNLVGIRQIHASNFVIEPGTPSSGWTALVLNNSYDISWTRFPTATFRGFWIEVTGSGLDYTVYQTRGRTVFISTNSFQAPFKIDADGAAEIINTSFSSNSNPLDSYFSLDTYTCQVKLTNCTYRNPGTAITDPRFTFDNCSNSPSGGAGTEPFRATTHNNQQSQLLWAFDGGYPDPGRVSVQTFGGTTLVPTVNATFGRSLNIVPSAGAVNAFVQGKLRGSFAQGGQMFVVARGTLPTIPSGSLEMTFLFNGTNIGGGKVWVPADSGTGFVLALPVTAQTVNPTTMGVRFNGSATTNWQLYQLELWIGKSLPSVTMPSFPQNVQTYAAATPSAGEWARGDIIWNNTTSAGGTPGWVCTTGGTPGTWKAMANVAP